MLLLMGQFLQRFWSCVCLQSFQNSWAPGGCLPVFSPSYFGREAPPFFSLHRAGRTVHLQMWLLCPSAIHETLMFLSSLELHTRQPPSVQLDLMLPLSSHFMPLDPPRSFCTVRGPSVSRPCWWGTCPPSPPQAALSV